jgi:hypothetical protein
MHPNIVYKSWWGCSVFERFTVHQVRCKLTVKCSEIANCGNT